MTTKFHLPSDGFNRYMTVNPDGEPVWESGQAAGMGECDAWCEFLRLCAFNECEGAWDYALIATGLNDDGSGDDEVIKKMESLSRYTASAR